MHKYTAAEPENNNDILVTRLQDLENRARTRARVVIETSAASDIRVRWVRGEMHQVLAKARSARGGRFKSAEHSLVYNNKLQALTTGEENPPAKKRPEKLTKKAGRRIREGVGVLKEKFGKKVAFVTLTLPGSTQEAKDALAEHSRGILNAYLQRLRDSWRRGALSTGTGQERCSSINEEASASGELEETLDYVGVWEYQQRGALHIHVAIGIVLSDDYKYLKEHHRSWWTSVLEHYSDKIGVDLFAREDGGSWRSEPERTRTECHRVKKDVGRYMSKYISKATKGEQKSGQRPPSRWWFMSDSLRDETNERRKMVVGLFDDANEAAAARDELSFFAKATARAHFDTTNPFTNVPIGSISFGEPEAQAELFTALEGYLNHRAGKCEHGKVILDYGDHQEVEWETVDEETGEVSYFGTDFESVLRRARGAPLSP